VIETLLTALSDENNRDWMLLLAGYTEPMLKLFSINPGLDSRIPECNRFYFLDYTVDELMQMADLYCREHNYRMTLEARKALHAKVKKDYSRKTDTFGNGRYIKTLLRTEVIPAMSVRVNNLETPTITQLITIEREDIPQQKLKDYRKPLKKLQNMVGLNFLKQNIESHLNMVKLNMLRAEQGIPTEMPPLHMVFMGNPGTGKTTVADFIGEIYASMGLLSIGRVIKVERKDLVGTVIGETEQKTAEILKRAQGNVLFIDEAYTLCDHSKQGNDFGRRAMEVLLTTLSKEHIDMMVIFAGYPKEMTEFLDINPGLRSRVPYTFYFED
jgi:SpoVK/Ycf46/Vps4 family AAA+-type ATPase